MMPPLSDAEVYQSFKSKLEGLLAEVSDARNSGDDAKLQDAMDALLDFSSPFDDLNQKASEILQAANTADLGQAVAAFARIAKELGEVQGGLQEGTAAAQSGKNELLIPKLADTTTKALSELKALKSGIDTIVQQAGQVHDLQGFNNLLPQVIATLGQLKQAAGGVGIDVPDDLSNTLQSLSRVLTAIEAQKESLNQFIRDAGNAHDVADVVSLLPEAISKLEELQQTAKDVGIG